jgi:hypothetical protein
MESIIVLRDEINRVNQALDEIEERDRDARRTSGQMVPSMDEGQMITVNVVWLAWMLNYFENPDEEPDIANEARNA